MTGSPTRETAREGEAHAHHCARFILAGLLVGSSLAPGPAVAQAETDEGGGSTFDNLILDTDRALKHRLPRRLTEISGLAATPDGRLFGHGDERGIVYEIDPLSGDVTKAFGLGPLGIQGDFEGLAIVGERFFLVTSIGALYEFREGAHEASVDFQGYDVGLRGRCEIEGLAYWEAEESLLLACKTTKGADLEGHMVIFDLALDGLRVDPQPRFRIPWQDLDGYPVPSELRPSGIVVDPATGNILVLSSRGPVMVELSPAGKVIDARRLARRRHRQPEGIELGEDGALIVADEGSGSSGRLTVYPVSPTPATGGRE